MPNTMAGAYCQWSQTSQQARPTQNKIFYSSLDVIFKQFKFPQTLNVRNWERGIG